CPDEAGRKQTASRQAQGYRRRGQEPRGRGRDKLVRPRWTYQTAWTRGSEGQTRNARDRKRWGVGRISLRSSQKDPVPPTKGQQLAGRRALAPRPGTISTIAQQFQEGEA